MRIGIDARFAVRNRRGIGNYTLNLVSQLAEIDRDNEYVLYLDRDDSDGVLPRRPNFVSKRLSPANYFLWEQVALPREAQADRLDVLHCTANTGPLRPPQRVKLVLSILDVMYMLSYSELGRSSSLYQRMGRHYRRLVVPRAAREAARVVTISEFSKNDILKHFPFVSGGSVSPTLLATTLDPDLVKTPPEPSPKIREAIERGSYLLAMGALDPRKNTEYLIRNFLALRNDGRIGENLIIIGIPNWRGTELYQRVRQLPGSEAIVFTDFVSPEDLVVLYRRAALFVYPSLYEGFGLPPLEAMTCGAAVITSNLTSIPEIVGDAALLIDPRSDRELQEAVLRVLHDRALRDALVEKGHRQAARFSWRRTAEETLQVYLAAAGGGK